MEFSRLTPASASRAMSEVRTPEDVWSSKCPSFLLVIISNKRTADEVARGKLPKVCETRGLSLPESAGLYMTRARSP